MVILSGDHIYKMDYSDMVARHKAAGAACTISVMEVPLGRGLPRFGIMSVNEEDMITEFCRKAQGAQEQPGLHGNLRLLLEDPAPLSHRG